MLPKFLKNTKLLEGISWKKGNLLGRKCSKERTFDADSLKVLGLPCKLTNQNPVEPFVMRMERGLMRQG